MIDYISSKILPSEQALRLVNTWRATHARIVFTNGVFDLVHPGHLHYLSEARALGTHLIVGLNADVSVRRLKGTTRPVMDQEARALLLASLLMVDLVVLFEADTPIDLITLLKPDILVKGGDYRPETIVGAPEVRSWGGDVRVLSFLEGYSSSMIIEKIRTAEEA